MTKQVEKFKKEQETITNIKFEEGTKHFKKVMTEMLGKSLEGFIKEWQDTAKKLEAKMMYHVNEHSDSLNRIQSFLHEVQEDDESDKDNH